jgi:hypothetical protein
MTRPQARISQARLSQARVSIVLLAAAGLLACSKTAGPPTGFGVNVTIDATSLVPTERAKITTATLTVVSDKMGTTPVKRGIDLHAAIQGGTVRFHYTPGTDVAAGDKLTFGLDALDGTALVASGTSEPVKLAATAVEVTITLAGVGDGGMTNPDGATDGGKGNGIACVTDDECGTGFCSDHVCCNERCNDVCVSCNLAATKGACTAYAVNSDPEMECAAKLPPAPDTDAGTATDDGGAEAGASDASTEAGASDAYVFNTPDGGIMTMPTSCGGTCGGARACTFPTKTTACGTSFCNSRRDLVSFACDGNGGCAPAVSMCADYACDDTKGACRTSCSDHVECLAGEYCDNHKCVTKNANGLGCAFPDACSSGYCIAGICCNTSCSEAGQSCNPGGGAPAGKCQCQGVNCGAAACQVFYQDSDGDTFGNSIGTIGLGTAKAGCMGAAPPAGFVADNTDCDDGDAAVHPGQTGWFGVPSKGKGIFDYNCDGTKQKETPEYPGGSCKFCGAVGTCSATTTTCAAANRTASFQCPQEYTIYRALSEAEPSLPSLGGAARLSLLPAGDQSLAPSSTTPAAVTPVPIVPCGIVCSLPQCCGCASGDKTGFLQAVECGDGTKFVYTCGACAAAGGGAAASTRVLKLQQCH